MREDLEYIAAAYAGRCEMLEALFGTGKKSGSTTPPPTAAPPRSRRLTPDAFDRMFPPGNDNG